MLTVTRFGAPGKHHSGANEASAALNPLDELLDDQCDRLVSSGRIPPLQLQRGFSRLSD